MYKKISFHPRPALIFTAFCIIHTDERRFATAPKIPLAFHLSIKCAAVIQSRKIFPDLYFPVPVKRFLIFFLLSSFNKHILDTFSLYNKCQIVEEHINYLPPHKVDATKGPPLRCTTLYSHSF